MNFFKFEATGNDFIILNQPYNAQAHDSTWVKRLCEKHTGIGADGLFFIWQKGDEWQWKFFNNDGSVAKFCGNAARCATLWLHQQIDPHKREWTWTDGEQVFKSQAETTQNNTQKVDVLWDISKLKSLEIKSHHQAMIKQLQEIGLENAKWVSAGVPHLVLIGSSWPRKIRHLFYTNHLNHHPEFIKESNISWLSRTDMTLVSYERGIEAETLSCGSGALSAYFALKLRSKEDKNLKVPSEIEFHFPGGPLKVKEDGENLRLSGPVRKVFEGYYNET
ncbi:MAG: diaminopimelate epimerase [Bdellovibrionota bacterium]